MLHEPVIILVNTQRGENIGAAARAMMNFGLRELRLVMPRDGWPNKRAYEMSSGASEILDRAKLFDSTADAVADLHRLYATTARNREKAKPVAVPEFAVKAMDAALEAGERVGILFGPERTGLVNEDVVRCDHILTIPIHPHHPSLNIAQSIVVVAYEWFCHYSRTPRGLAELENLPLPQTNERGNITVGQWYQNNPDSSVLPLGKTEIATNQEVQGFFDHLESELDKGDFFKSADKKPKMWRNIRNMFMRSSLTSQDIRTLRGIIRSLVEISPK